MANERTIDTVPISAEAFGGTDYVLYHKGSTNRLARRAHDTFVQDLAPGVAAEVEAYKWKGAWATATAYALGDEVRAANGSGYICTTAHTSGATTEPGVGADWATVWDLRVEKGAAGTDSTQLTVSNATPTPGGSLTAELAGYSAAIERVEYLWLLAMLPDSVVTSEAQNGASWKSGSLTAPAEAGTHHLLARVFDGGKLNTYYKAITVA